MKLTATYYKQCFYVREEALAITRRHGVGDVPGWVKIAIIWENYKQVIRAFKGMYKVI